MSLKQHQGPLGICPMEIFLAWQWERTIAEHSVCTRPARCSVTYHEWTHLILTMPLGGMWNCYDHLIEEGDAGRKWWYDYPSSVCKWQADRGLVPRQSGSRTVAHHLNTVLLQSRAIQEIKESDVLKNAWVVTKRSAVIIYASPCRYIEYIQVSVYVFIYTHIYIYRSAYILNMYIMYKYKILWLWK